MITTEFNPIFVLEIEIWVKQARKEQKRLGVSTRNRNALIDLSPPPPPPPPLSTLSFPTDQLPTFINSYPLIARPAQYTICWSYIPFRLMLLNHLLSSKISEMYENGGCDIETIHEVVFLCKASAIKKLLSSWRRN